MKTLKENLLKNVGVGRVKLIEKWMYENLGYTDYMIEKDYTITINNNVPRLTISYHDYDELPEYIQFNNVDLKGRPLTVYIYAKNLKSLRGLPATIKTLEITSEGFSTLPPLEVTILEDFRLKGKSINKIENLIIHGNPNQVTFYEIKATLENVQIDLANTLDVGGTSVGSKISRAVKDETIISDKTLIKIRKLLGGIDVDNLSIIRYQLLKELQRHITKQEWVKVDAAYKG